jgi:hypothetical protein
MAFTVVADPASENHSSVLSTRDPPPGVDDGQIRLPANLRTARDSNLTTVNAAGGTEVVAP